MVKSWKVVTMYFDWKNYIIIPALNHSIYHLSRQLSRSLLPTFLKIHHHYFVFSLTFLLSDPLLCLSYSDQSGIMITHNQRSIYDCFFHQAQAYSFSKIHLRFSIVL